MKMSRRLLSAAIALVLGIAALVTGAGSAHATSHYTHISRGFSLWTKEYCEDGRLLNMHRLHWGSQVQGRQYVYLRSGRLCVFVVDHMPGSHHIRVFAKVPGGSYSEDDGTYSSYAGAFAAPKGKCLQAVGTLFLGSRPYQYQAVYAPTSRGC